MFGASLFLSLLQEVPSGREVPAQEAPFRLAEWREKPSARIHGRDVKIGAILDYIESHYAPGLGKELDGPYGYYQIHSSDFDAWVDDYVDLMLLAPLAAERSVSAQPAEVEAEAKKRSEEERQRYVDQKILEPAAAGAVLPSLIARCLRNQGLAIEKQILLGKLFPRPFTPTDLRAHYVTHAHRFGGSVRASQILLAMSDPKDGKRLPLEARESLRKEAEALVKQLREGSDFAEAVRLNSDDEASKKRGGDMGYFRRSAPLPEALTRAAFLAVPGDIVGPVETPLGFHILKVVDRRVTRHPEFLEVRLEVDEDLFRERSGRLLEELRAKAGLIIY